MFHVTAFLLAVAAIALASALRLWPSAPRPGGLGTPEPEGVGLATTPGPVV